jgi:phosphoribosylanthranilate isomerase
LTRVKICGVTSLDDGLAAAQAGADLIGLNFYKAGPRYIDPAAAGQLASGLRATLGADCPPLVGVFVNMPLPELLAIGDQVSLDFFQLHGDEPSETLAGLDGRGFKALRPKSLDEALAQVDGYLPFVSPDERAPSFLLDAYHPALFGGTGEQASLEVALAVRQRVPRLMLAGGLTPENVEDRVAAIRPWGVDAASGVENGNPRRKDHERIRAFVHAAQSGGKVTI